MPCRFASTRGTRRAVGSQEREIPAVRAGSGLIASVDRPQGRRFLYDLLARCAEVELQRGDWDGARRSARASVDAARECGRRSPYGLYVLALLEAAQARELECRRHVATLLSLDGNGAEWVCYADSILGLLELGLGRVDAAIAHLEPLAADPRRSGPPSILWAPNLIEGYVRRGHVREASEACSRLLAEPDRRYRGRGRAVAARCHALVATPDAYEHAFRRALAWHGYQRDPFERARTELCFGERLRRDRKRAQARTFLASALAVFERLGAVPWADRAASEFGAGCERSSRPEGAATYALTAGENHVAGLVARGYTNREAAASLFVSPKTVEFHLGHVYRKLGIRSRAELARVWANRGRLS